MPIEFLLNEDYGSVSISGLDDKVQHRFRDLTTKQLSSLWQYIFEGKFEFNSENENYESKNGEVVSEVLLEHVLSTSIEMYTEIALVKIRMYLKNSVSKSTWYLFYGTNPQDEEAREEVYNYINSIL